MLKGYFLKRLVATVPTLFGVSLLCFALVQLTPGGPVEAALAEWQHASGEAGGSRVALITEEQRQALIHYYGFDKPLPVRYVHWMGNCLTGNLGESYYYGEPVTRVLGRALPFSFGFCTLSLLLTYLICIPLGVWKARRNGSLGDELSSLATLFLYSMPEFALGILLIVFFAGGTYFNWFAINGITSDGFETMSRYGKLVDLVRHLFLPLVCYTVTSLASLTLFMKNSMLEQLRQDYVTTARAKGCSDKRIVRRHVLRNALLPIASSIGQWLSLYLTGTLLVETIFGLQGVGRLSYEAIQHRDYPVVLGTILLLSMIFVAGNLLSDFLYTLIDPRIDFA